MLPVRPGRRRIAAVSAVAALAGLLATPTAHAAPGLRPDTDAQPRRLVENLDRGLVAVPSGKGTFLSWRLLGTEYGSGVAFNVYRGGKRLNHRPVTASTTYQDNGRGRGTYTVRVVVDGRERKPSGAALDFGKGYAEIPLSEAGGYTVQHAWPGDLDGDGRYELVVSRLSGTRDRPDLLEAYTLAGDRLWRIDQGPGSYTQVSGNGANDPAPAAISGSTPIGGFRNDDNVTVYDLDGDGRAEVLVHTADGTTFADGESVEAASPAEQFVSVVDGATGTERTRRPVPDDLTADGPSGGQFGIAYLDGIHPSLVTKLVTRVGAKRGAFRTLIQTWDFDGRALEPRWKFAVPSDSGATSFHQIRTVDVDRDGKDDIADGNYVVNSDGTLRYVIDGAGHGDRFHIADLDPARPGLEGFAVQQSELGVVSRFPWYYYDADTGERLVTGSTPPTRRARPNSTSAGAPPPTSTPATRASNTGPPPPTSPHRVRASATSGTARSPVRRPRSTSASGGTGTRGPNSWTARTSRSGTPPRRAAPACSIRPGSSRARATPPPSTGTSSATGGRRSSRRPTTTRLCASTPRRSPRPRASTPWLTTPPTASAGPCAAISSPRSRTTTSATAPRTRPGRRSGPTRAQTAPGPRSHRTLSAPEPAGGPPSSRTAGA